MKQKLKFNISGVKSAKPNQSTSASSASASVSDLSMPTTTSGLSGAGQYPYVEDIRRVDLLSNVNNPKSGGNDYYNY